MSPEQAVGESTIDGRSDIYSLGCVLFEMLDGKAPFPERSGRSIIVAHVMAEPRALDRDDVPPGVTRALSTALAKDREDRFPTARAFADALSTGASGEVLPKQRARRVRPRVAASVGALVAIAAVALALTATSSGIAFEKRGWIVVADFTSTVGEPQLGRTLASALTAGLQQSTNVNVLPRQRIAETLERMRRPPGSDTLLDESLAREVAQREDVRFVVVGDVGRVGESYVLTVRIVDAATGEAVRTRSTRARGRDDVIASLDKLVRGLRRDFGESALGVRRQTKPLPKVTTASLDALKKYAEGRRLWANGDRAAGLMLLEEAVALDSSFALAHGAIGVHYYWNNDSPRGEAHFERALAEADRLTDRERLSIRAQAEAWRGNRDEASVLYTALLTAYPDDRTARYAHGYNYLRAGRMRDARDVFARLTAEDTLNASALINLATALTALNDHEPALAAYHRAFAIDSTLKTSENLNNEYGSLLIRMGRLDEAGRVFAMMLPLDTRARARGHRSLGMLYLYRGRYADGMTHLREAALLARSIQSGLTEMRNRLFLVSALDGKGQRDAATAEMRRINEIFRTSYIQPVMLMYVARTAIRRGDVGMARVFLDSIVARTPIESDEDRAIRALVTGELAIAEGRPRDALASVELAYRLDSSAFYLESVANAMANAGDYVGAIARYEKMSESPEFGWEAQEAYSLVHHRLGRLHERKGDTAAAVVSYEKFLEKWRGADADIREVIDARERLRSLTKSTSEVTGMRR
jgi:tetratricopeptide (TPR) repeat protein/TolB-like protein